MAGGTGCNCTLICSTGCAGVGAAKEPAGSPRAGLTLAGISTPAQTPRSFLCRCLWLPLIFAMHLLHHFFNILTLNYQTLDSSFLTQPSLRISGEENKKPNSNKRKEALAPSNPSTGNITRLGYCPKILTSHPRDTRNAFGSK